MITDWRGTEVKVGSPVVYGATVGRSVELVEGEVVGFTPSGRVNVRIVRRAYRTGAFYSREVVHVGADRLIVIKPDGLPPTTVPTLAEQVEKDIERMDQLRQQWRQT